MTPETRRFTKALHLANLGFYVFPIIKNTKFPACRFKEEATRDRKKIAGWWENRDYNIGIYTGKFGDGQALVAVDIDNKPNKNGIETAKNLDLPATFTQLTPSGGKHLVYVADAPVKQGVSVLGKGIDIRSKGGYVVADGSEIDGKAYVADHTPLTKAPDWILEKCSFVEPTNLNGNGHKKIEVDEKSSLERGIDWLKREAPLALEGEGGDQTTFLVAAKIKDFGIDPVDCLDLLFTYWNSRCEPPWSSEELAIKVENAYRYGKNPQGVDSPEFEFGSVSSPAADTHPAQDVDSLGALCPIEKLNKEFSFLSKNSEIIWETVNYKNEPELLYLSISEFNNHLLSHTLIDGNSKPKQISKLWLSSPKRRSYISTCFYPGKNPPPQFYNLWRGFSVEEFRPSETIPVEAARSLDDLLTHIKENICDGIEEDFLWLIGYFAHMIQRPFEKPHTSVVLKGRKGTGKNIVVDCIGSLIEQHKIVVANRRYLTGNFNSHLEKLLLLTLDEAFWSGEKSSEGILKDLITGRTHMIERKGQEPYPVDNLTRVVIIGNEDWVVPASEDERRYGVFNVGDARRGDLKFFGDLMKGMRLGGSRLLLSYLKNFDLSKINVNAAPITEGLLEQKTASLDPFHQYWFDSLKNGSIENISSEIPWPKDVSCDLFRDAVSRYFKERNIRSWMPGSRQIGKELRRLCPGVSRRQKRDRENGGIHFRVYELPSLLEARLDWEQFIGHKVKWDDDR